MGVALALFAGLMLAGNAFAAPCFSVDGTKVSVNQLFTSDVKAHVVDLEDMPSVSTMVSRGSEGHNLIFMNIKRDAAKKNVVSFSAKIDDKPYDFPGGACAKK
jgi:hypothetical protein